MQVKILNEKAIIPKKAYEGDAGFDVYSLEDKILKQGEFRQFKLGIAIEIPLNTVAIMSERSGMAMKFGITSIGNIIDSNYRGEISIILINLGPRNFEIKAGDRIGQIILSQLVRTDSIEVEELSDSERGERAHYSSGK